ncbi:MAG: hypothetical protein JJU45_05610 [Acidimicrobiia bacterium]|nr:hypothetical protein [Acidimicrobiia bacterium]
MRVRHTSALFVAALFATAALAGCGDDDASGTDPADNGAAGDAPADESAAGGDDDNTVADPGDGQPSTLVGDELDDVAIPDVGTAVISVDGTEYVFEELGNCRITVDGTIETFAVTGSGETDDGALTALDVSRSVHTVDDVEEWQTYERDWVQLSVQQDPGSDPPAFSNTIMEATREVLGGPVTGDASAMPVIKVVDGDDGLVATAVGEVSFMAGMGDIDAAGEGPFEFAANCG